MSRIPTVRGMGTTKRMVLLLIIAGKLVMVVLLSRRMFVSTDNLSNKNNRSIEVEVVDHKIQTDTEQPTFEEDKIKSTNSQQDDEIIYVDKLLSHHKDDGPIIKISTQISKDEDVWYKRPTKEEQKSFTTSIEKWIETSEPGDYPDISQLDNNSPVCDDIFRFGGVHNSKSPTGWPICMELLPNSLVEETIHKTFKGCSSKDCKPQVSNYSPSTKRIKQKPTPCIVYSFGIGEEDSFEQHLSLDTKCEVFAFDPVVAVGKWVAARDRSVEKIRNEGASRSRSSLENAVTAMKQDKDTSRYYTQMSILNTKASFKFNPWGLAATTSTKELQNSWSKGEKSSIDLRSLNKIQTSLSHSEIDILKLDIEGFEWQVLSNVISQTSISQLMIELHFGGAGQWLEAFKALHAAGFRVYHSEKLRYHGRGCKKSRIDPKCRGGLQEVSFMRIPS